MKKIAIYIISVLGFISLGLLIHFSFNKIEKQYNKKYFSQQYTINGYGTNNYGNADLDLSDGIVAYSHYSHEGYMYTGFDSDGNEYEYIGIRYEDTVIRYLPIEAIEKLIEFSEKNGTNKNIYIEKMYGTFFPDIESAHCKEITRIQFSTGFGTEKLEIVLRDCPEEIDMGVTEFDDTIRKNNIITYEKLLIQKAILSCEATNAFKVQDMDNYYVVHFENKEGNHCYLIIYDKNKFDLSYINSFCKSFRIPEIIILTILFILFVITIWRIKTNQNTAKVLDREKNTFTNGVSHDMKTPLAIISNICECYMEGVSPEKNDAYIKAIDDETQKLNGEIDSLIYYNNLTNTSCILKEAVNLSVIVKEQIGRFESLLDGKTITSELEDDIIIKANKEMIQVVVSNYISNAVKFGTPNSEIVVKLNKKKFSIENECEDISFIKDKTIWKLLTVRDSSRNRDKNSTGMGLPVTAEICRIHKLEYGVVENNGKAEFYILIKANK